jgi:FkbM family methyltransferase
MISTQSVENATLQSPLMQDRDLFDMIRASSLPPPVGIIQVGASFGQEFDHFIAEGITSGVFIEPLQKPFEVVASMCQQLVGFVAAQALCSDCSGKTVNFNVASNGGMSSSLLTPGSHIQQFDWVKFDQVLSLTTITLDELMTQVFAAGFAPVCNSVDTLYMDTQGAELKILQGAHQTLKFIKYVFTEVTRNNMYVGAPTLSDLTSFMEFHGFTLNNVNFNRFNHADALFVRYTEIGI